MRRLLSFIAFAVALFGCVKTSPDSVTANCMIETVEVPMTFIAGSGDEGGAPVRTVLQDGGAVYWEPSDAISIFAGSGSAGGSRFVSTNTEPAASAEFSGSVTVSVGASGSEFWGVYPYSESNAFDGTAVTLTVRDEQPAVAGTFASGMSPTIAKTSGSSLSFYNICGGLRFVFTRSDIRSITFCGNDSETLAGTIRVAFDGDGKPEVLGVTDPRTSVTLTAPAGGCFIPGDTYFMMLLPTTLEKGFTLTMLTSGMRKGVAVSNKSNRVKRAVMGLIPEPESHVSAWETAYDAVDLGLPSGTKWAAVNLGAAAPEEAGLYYAWGEIYSKSSYSWANLAYLISGNSFNNVLFSKYTTSSTYVYGGGEPDGLVTLQPEDDAATCEWGGDWHTPTAAQMEELQNAANCTSTWTTRNGVEGRLYTSRVNGNTLFLPAAGYHAGTSVSSVGALGSYLTSSLHSTDNYDSFYGYFHSSYQDCRSGYRYIGRSLRPVK